MSRFEDQKRKLTCLTESPTDSGGDFELCFLAGKVCIERNFFVEVVEGIKVFYGFKTRDYTLDAVWQVQKPMHINAVTW